MAGHQVRRKPNIGLALDIRSQTGSQPVGWDDVLDTCTCVQACSTDPSDICMHTHAHLHTHTHTHTDMLSFLLHSCTCIPTYLSVICKDACVQSHNVKTCCLPLRCKRTHTRTPAMQTASYAGKEGNGQWDFREPPIGFLALICHPRHSLLPVANFSLP